MPLDYDVQPLDLLSEELVLGYGKCYLFDETVVLKSLLFAFLLEAVDDLLQPIKLDVKLVDPA